MKFTRSSETARPTRRRFLAQAGAAALATAAAQPPLAAQQAAQERSRSKSDTLKDFAMKGFIDAHVHVWTDDVAAWPLAPGYKKENMRPASFTPDELLTAARAEGVDRIVLIQMSFYRYDNRYMLEAVKKHPGVFSAVAVIDPADRPAETMKALARQGVRGFRIVSDGKPLDQWLAGDGMAAMWTAGAKENLAICCLINPDALPSVDAMCAKHPDTPVVIDHFARVGMKGPIAEPDLKNLCRLARHKNVSVKVSAFYALGEKRAPYDDLKPMIRRLVDAYGANRLMWATDCPFQVQDGHTYKDSIALVRDRCDFLSAEDKAWILGKTAEKRFFS